MSQLDENLSPEEKASQGFAEAERRIEKAKREKDIGLDLVSLGLTRLPETLGQLTALQSLDLSINQLTTLPEWLGQLTALQGLGLRNNQLTTLPESLGQLAALQWLDLANKISDRGGVKITRRVRLAPCRERFDGRARTVL